MHTSNPPSASVRRVVLASFIGTTTTAPLDLFVNNQRGLRLEDNGDGSDSGTTPDGAPNLIGGSPANSVAGGVVGATMGTLISYVSPGATLPWIDCVSPSIGSPWTNANV